MLCAAGRSRGRAGVSGSTRAPAPGVVAVGIGLSVEWTLVEPFSPLRFRMRDFCAGFAMSWSDGELFWVASELSWGRVQQTYVEVC